MLAPAIQARFDALVEGGALPLPLLPDAASRALSLAQRADCDLAQLAQVLRRDPSLTAHVMRVAASPLYLGAAAITSVQQAIHRLGLVRITQVVLAVASRTRVFAVAGFEAEVALAFRHALTAGLYAQEIARARRSSVDVAFLAGLFHDFGRPVLLQALVDLHRDAGAAVEHADVVAAADVPHAAVGARLVERWAMPASVAEAVHRHHAPAGCELATLVALADRFAHTGAGDAALAAPLNLYPDDLAAIARRGDDIARTVDTIA